MKYLKYDLVKILSGKNGRRIIAAANIMLVFCFLLFFVGWFYPNLRFFVTHKETIYDQEVLLMKGNRLKREIMSELEKYKQKKAMFNKIIRDKSPYNPSEIFNRVIKMIYELGISNVGLKIGTPISQETINSIKRISVPVTIEAAVRLDQLPDFFDILTENMFYEINNLETNYDPGSDREKIIAKLSIIFYYKSQQVPKDFKV